MTLPVLTTVFAAETAIGGVDKSSLSVQTLMELLVSGFTSNTVNIRPDSEVSADVAQWNDLLFNSDGIVSIGWSRKGLEGSLVLQWLPETITRAVFSRNSLSGSVNLMVLPPKMITMNLSINKFSGVIDLTKLPPTMRFPYLDNNDFEGATDFNKLPDRLESLSVDDTKIQGEVERRRGRIVSCDRSGVKIIQLK